MTTAAQRFQPDDAPPAPTISATESVVTPATGPVDGALPAEGSQPTQDTQPAELSGSGSVADSGNPPEAYLHLPKVAYFNRELSWLAFNRRVLDLARSRRLPLLERMKFLSIVSSNLDEFFEIRVAGLIQQVEQGYADASIDGLGPKEQLRRIHDIVESLVEDQYQCWSQEVEPALEAAGVLFRTAEELDEAQMAWVRNYFADHVFPVLTPMGIDPAHPFPQLLNKGLYLLVLLEDPDTAEPEPRLAVIPVPRILPRLVEVEIPGRPNRTYLWLSDLIKIFDDSMFLGYRLKGAWAFRITRNSDLYIDEEEVENLLKTIQAELAKRRKGAPVRLEIEAGVDDAALADLLRRLNFDASHVYKVRGPINLLRLMSLYGMLELPALRDAPLVQHTPAALSKERDYFAALRQDDYLLHHPYDSFSPVVELLRQAARDPQVFAIKLTLYRTSDNSPIVGALKEACENGKQVTALVELKARADEENNIHWANELESVGVHVVYGIVGLKTHCKCTLIVRREGDGLRRYCHLGTGNYNPSTARLYTDLSLFTARRELTAEVASLFNTLTGFSRNPRFDLLLIAPFNLHRQMQALILAEARNAAAGHPARIIAKCNSLIEKETIDNLYRASRAGVKIDLIVRGICALVPGVPGLSENIRVISVVGRFLEHSRIYYFENHGHQPLLYLGSADWMHRNFFRRIECVFPVLGESQRKEIIGEILPAMLKDDYAFELQPGGAYTPVTPPPPPAESITSDPSSNAASHPGNAASGTASPGSLRPTSPPEPFDSQAYFVRRAAQSQQRALSQGLG